MAAHTSRNKGVLFLAALMPWVPALAQESGADASESGAVCRLCPDYSGLSGWIELGPGYQSDDSFKFGQYTGLKDDGLFGNGGAQIQYRGDDGRYIDFDASNLGLTSRDAKVEGGQQGLYELHLEYDQLPNFLDDTTETPFRGKSGSDVGLPSNWVPGSSSQNMPTLQESLRDVDLKTMRRKVGTGFSIIPFKNWEVTGRYSHEKQDGTRSLGATFGFSQTSILPAPVDYETDDFGVGINYTGQKLQAQLAYDGSLFNENNKALDWQNPFVNPASSTARGQLANPPDNDYHKVSATVGYDVVEHTRVTGHVALGKMRQNANFLPYTINPTIQTSPLPANDLDGEVDTTLAKVEVSSRPLTKLRLHADYTYSHRDNKSDQNVYEYVITDQVIPPDAHENLPYSFKQYLFRANAGYQLPMRSDISAGFDYDKMDYTYQEVNNTKDRTVWTKLKVQPHDMVYATLDYAYSNRDRSSYNPVPEIIPPQNPRFTIYNLADRKRNKAGLRITATPTTPLTIGLGVDYYKDNYNKIELGLEEAKGKTYTADVAYMFNEDITGTAFFVRDDLDSHQAGSNNFENPDWFLTNEDVTDTFGVGVTWQAIADKLDVGADVIYSKYTGKLDFRNSEDLPDLKSKLTGVRVHGTYQLQKNLSVRLDYMYQRYRENDWQIDGIAVNTVPSIVGLGAEEQDYNVNVVAATLRYEF